MFRRVLVCAVLVAIAVVVARAIGPDIKRYIKISRM